MAKKNLEQDITPEKKKSTSAVFILIFNSFIITAIAAFNSEIGYTTIAIALFFFQSILTKNFVESQYLVD